MNKILVGVSSEINNKFILKLKKSFKLNNIVFKNINKNDSDEKILKKIIKLDIFITKYLKLPNNFFKNKNKLKLLQLTTSDYSFIDIKNYKKHSLKIANNNGSNAISVSEHIFLLMLTIYRNFINQLIVKKNKWNNLKIYNQELFNKKIGIIGMGNIGFELAKRCNSFGMDIFYYDIRRKSKFIEKKKGLKYQSVNKIFKNCDFISLNMSLNAKSEKLVNLKLLSTMKKNSVIINTSRGKILKNRDIYKILKKNKIFFGALDVFETEPLPMNSPLRRLNNIVMTPHCGPSKESYNRLLENIVVNIKLIYLKKNLKNLKGLI